MRKLFCIAISAILFATPAMAQNDTVKTEKKPKKESGFFKALKKGVESVSGIDVSKETLFVYPTIGEHKFRLISCKGDKATGEVRITLDISYYAEGKLHTQPVISEVHYNKAKQDVIKHHHAHPFFYTEATPIAFTFADYLVGVPTDVVNIERLVFKVGYTSENFEARDMPITWE